MPHDDLNLRPRKRVSVRFFENTAEAITFWACVTGLLFLALLYTFKYLKLDKTTVPLEKVNEVRGELNREIDNLKLANGRLVLQLEAMQQQLHGMKTRLNDVGLQVDSLQLPKTVLAADSTTLDSSQVNVDSLGESWGIDPQQMTLPFEIEQKFDSTAAPEKRPAEESWAPKTESDSISQPPFQQDSTAIPATDSTAVDSTVTPETVPDSSSVPDSLSGN